MRDGGSGWWAPFCWGCTNCDRNVQSSPGKARRHANELFLAIQNAVYKLTLKYTMWMCIYIPHMICSWPPISHHVSWRFTILLSEIGRQLVTGLAKAPLAAAISPYLISLTHPITRDKPQHRELRALPFSNVPCLCRRRGNYPTRPERLTSYTNHLQCKNATHLVNNTYLESSLAISLLFRPVSFNLTNKFLKCIRRRRIYLREGGGGGG